MVGVFEAHGMRSMLWVYDRERYDALMMGVSLLVDVYATNTFGNICYGVGLFGP